MREILKRILGVTITPTINNFFTNYVPIAVDSIPDLMYNYGNLGENVFFKKHTLALGLSTLTERNLVEFQC